MTHPLDGAYLKLERAKEHINAFGEESVSYLNSHFCHLDFHDDDEFRNVFLIIDKQPPIHLSTILGDCVHNIRSALDHLSWQLVLVNRQRPTTNTAFPIFLSKEKYGRFADRMVKGMSPEAVTLIKEVQPYKRGKNPRSHPLWFLRELDNADKHRTLNLTQGRIIPAIVKITTRDTSVAPAWIKAGVLHHGAKVAAFRLSDYSSGDYVKMDGEAMSLITLEKPERWSRDPVIALVGAALNYVGQDVLPRFESLFGSTP